MSGKGAPLSVAAVLATNKPLNMEVFGIRAVHTPLIALLHMFNDHLERREKCPVMVPA